MNTPKYYIGQKVMYDGESHTVVEIHFSDETYAYEYTLFSEDKKQIIQTITWHAKQEQITRPPAKLEFGYCAVGDVVVDRHRKLVILDVNRSTLIVSDDNEEPYHYGETVTYEQAKDRGWGIKEQETAPETITHNGLTYKLVE